MQVSLKTLSLAILTEDISREARIVLNTVKTHNNHFSEVRMNLHQVQLKYFRNKQLFSLSNGKLCSTVTGNTSTVGNKQKEG